MQPSQLYLHPLVLPQNAVDATQQARPYNSHLLATAVHGRSAQHLRRSHLFD